ncbi:MAG: hypothetical protein ACODAJ_14830, partial [Planctomycetota bacterium]
MLFLSLAPCALGGQPRDPDAPLTTQILAKLRAANEARAQLLREEEDWQAERLKLQLLLDTVRRETQRLEEQAAEARAKADELRQPLEELKARRERLERVEAMVDALAERLEKA